MQTGGESCQLLVSTFIDILEEKEPLFCTNKACFTAATTWRWRGRITTQESFMPGAKVSNLPVSSCLNNRQLHRQHVDGHFAPRRNSHKPWWTIRFWNNFHKPPKNWVDFLLVYPQHTTIFTQPRSHHCMRNRRCHWTTIGPQNFDPAKRWNLRQNLWFVLRKNVAYNAYEWLSTYTLGPAQTLQREWRFSHCPLWNGVPAGNCWHFMKEFMGVRVYVISIWQSVYTTEKLESNKKPWQWQWVQSAVFSMIW